MSDLAKLRSAFKDAKTDLAPLVRVPTGLLGFDYLTCGGLPVGRIVEIYGHEASGKTALSLWFSRIFLEKDKPVAYIDAERTLNAEDLNRVGIDANHELFVYWRPNGGEQALSMAIQAAESGVKLVVIDSVPALMPRVILEDKDVGDTTVAAIARLLSAEMARLISTMDRFDCTLIFLNQVRNKIGSYGNPETTPGGNSLKFMCSLILKMQRKEVCLSEPTGIVSQVKLEKSKISKPRTHTEIFIADAYGVDPNRNLKDTLLNLGLLVQKGSYFYWAEPFAEAHGLDTKIGQGAKAFHELIEANPQLYELLYKEVMHLEI